MARHCISKPRMWCNVVMVGVFVALVASFVYWSNPYRDPAAFKHAPGDEITVWASTLTSPQHPFAAHDAEWLAVPPRGRSWRSPEQPPAPNVTVVDTYTSNVWAVMAITAAANLRLAGFALVVPRADAPAAPQCFTMGTPVTLDAAAVATLRGAIDDGYRVTWYADFMQNVSPSEEDMLEIGMPLGVPARAASDGAAADGATGVLETLVNTHVRVIVRADAKGRITRFETVPLSRHACGDMRPQTIPAGAANVTLTYTYTLDWITVDEDDAWDVRFNAQAEKTTANAQIEWTMVGASGLIMLVVFAMLLYRVRTVLGNSAAASVPLASLFQSDSSSEVSVNLMQDHPDSAGYSPVRRDTRNREKNWALIQHDVFRKPNHATYLGCCTAAGLHFCVVLLVVPAGTVFMHGAFMSARVTLLAGVVFLASAPLEGYMAGRIGRQWKVEPSQIKRIARLAALTSLVAWAPGLLAWVDPAAPPSEFWTSGLRAMLCFVVVLVYVVLQRVGLAVGWNIARFKEPVETWPKARSTTQAVEGYWRCGRMTQAAVVSMFATLVATFLPLYFVVQSTWGNATVALTGVLFYFALAFVATTAMVAAYNTYLQLRERDADWHVPAFMTAAVTAAVSVLVAAVMYGAEFERYATDPTSIGRIAVFLLDIGFVTFIVQGSIAHACSYRAIVVVYRHIDAVKIS